MSFNISVIFIFSFFLDASNIFKIHLFDSIIEKFSNISDYYFSVEMSRLSIDENVNDYYSKRLEIINDILSNFPKDIILLLLSYANDKSFDDLNNKVMNRLAKFKSVGKNFTNFYNENFANHLFNILTIESGKIPPYDPFWYALSRLAFKWTIQKRQEEIESDHIKFEKILKNVNSIISIIKRDGELDTFSLYADPSSVDWRELLVLREWFSCELFENSHLFPLFALALNDFYNHGVDCRELEIKYFQGNFNTNLLLRFLVIFSDPMGRLRQECFSKGKIISKDFPFIKFDHSINIKSKQREKLSLNYLDDLRIHGPRDLKISNPKHLSITIVEFFIKSGRKFRISHCAFLVTLLEKLKEFKLLKGEILKQIIEFDLIQNGTPCWNQKTFIRFLLEAKKHDQITLNDFIEYLKIINLTESTIKSLAHR